MSPRHGRSRRRFKLARPVEELTARRPTAHIRRWVSLHLALWSSVQVAHRRSAMLAGLTYTVVIQQVSHRAFETFTPEDLRPEQRDRPPEPAIVLIQTAWCITDLGFRL